MILRELINKIGFKVDEKAFQDAEKKFVALANKAKYVSGAAGAVGAGMLTLAKKAGQTADQLLDLNQITGASTDTLQELKYISADAGVSFEGLSGIYSKFTNLLPSIQKGTSDSSKAFEQLGVALKDSKGEFRSTEELVPELIMSLQNVENVTERNAMAQKVFGRDLSALGPILGYTNEQFKNLAKEAHEMGVVLDKDTIDQANRFRAAFEKGMLSLQTNMNRFGASLAPVLENTLFPLFNKGIEKLNRFVSWFDGLNTTVKKSILFITGLTAGIAPMFLIVGKIIGLAGSAVVLAKKLKTGILAVNAAMAANPVIAVTLAVAGLITVLVLLIRNFDDVKAKAAQFWQGMVMLFNQGRELSGLAVQILIKQMKLWFFSFWEWFATRFPGLAAAVEVTFGRITEIMGSGIDFWKNLFQGMFALFTGDIDGFKEHFAAAFGFLGEYFAGIIDSMGGYIDLLWGWLEPVYNFLTGIFAGAVDKVKGGIAKVGEFFGFDGPEGPQPGGPYPGIIRPEATNNNSRQINVRSSISLAVPEGTPQHQRQSLQDSAERAVQAAFDRELRSLMANAAGGEVR